MQAGRLDRRVQFRRATMAHDGLASVETWANYGSAQWAEKTDISDGEKWRAGSVGASVTTRFRVRWSTVMSELTPKDRLVCDGRDYDIVGIKEIGRRNSLEITAAARIDQ